jgi:hypothetical protein
MAVPAWLELLGPLPPDAMAQRKPVASAEQIANGTAGPIAGWENVTLSLSEPEFGLRHVHVTLDANGGLLAGGDHVMFVRETTADGAAALTEHVSVGGRFETDGSFRGTHWRTILESSADDVNGSVARSAEHRPPSDEEIAALGQLIGEVMKRVTR